MRRTLVIFWLFLLLPVSASVVSAKQHIKLIETQETKVGEVVFFKLPGNPDIGFKYQLNRDLSTGLDLVSVNLLGWLMTSKSQTIFFRRRDIMNIAVRAIAPGQADLAFDYYRRMGGRTFIKTSIMRVIIKPSKTRP